VGIKSAIRVFGERSTVCVIVRCCRLDAVTVEDALGVDTYSYIYPTIYASLWSLLSDRVRLEKSFSFNRTLLTSLYHIKCHVNAIYWPTVGPDTPTAEAALDALECGSGVGAHG
jgi:hypothetical protein